MKFLVKLFNWAFSILLIGPSVFLFQPTSDYYMYQDSPLLELVEIEELMYTRIYTKSIDTGQIPSHILLS